MHRYTPRGCGLGQPIAAYLKLAPLTSSSERRGRSASSRISCSLPATSPAIPLAQRPVSARLVHILTLENLKLTTFSSGSQRAYCSAISSPSSLPKLYADSGRRSFSSVIGTFSGGCGCNGMPISVSDDARTMFFIPCFRLASRTLYVLQSMSDTPYEAGYNPNLITLVWNSVLLGACAGFGKAAR